MPIARVNGVDLYYEETGQGTPLVWSHEFGGDFRSWEPQVRYFSRRHRVVTGVALVASDTLEERHAVVESSVSMRAADDRELRAYIATGESLDKAGAYAAQGIGRRLIEKIEGSETNVIGLPLEETLALLRAVGFGAGPA